eukprot:COSAG02_NODE_155_length_33066_cov_32.167562_16_plen_128_part_00
MTVEGLGRAAEGLGRAGAAAVEGLGRASAAAAEGLVGVKNGRRLCAPPACVVHARATSVHGPRACMGSRVQTGSRKWEVGSRKQEFIISCPVPSAGAHRYARSQAPGPTGMPGPKRRGPQVCPVDVA